MKTLAQCNQELYEAGLRLQDLMTELQLAKAKREKLVEEHNKLVEQKPQERDLATMIDEILGEYHAGEFELKKLFRKLGYKVTDVSNNPNYWKKDIDLIIEDKLGVEVKWDQLIASTGNMFIETVSDTEKNKDGWFIFCKADLLFYGDAANKLYYVFRFSELKQWIEEHKEVYKVATAPDYGKDGVKKYSKGYLVPVESVKHLCFIERL